MQQATKMTIPVMQENDRPLIVSAYRDLLKSFKTPLNDQDARIIRMAFEMATKAHLEQRRKSGEPYILHPIEVARICVEEIGLGPTAAVCALLHDVVEDTHVEVKEIHGQFGERIARIVDGLTKLDGLHESENPQAENLSKVLKAMLFDVRVVLIKMADRLHNLRTIKSMPPHKQRKIAAETTSIYAPLAHRLGLYRIKTEFQDQCLKITNPEEYHDIAERLAQTKKGRQHYIDDFIRPVKTALEELGIKARVTGRPKSIHSIWNKIKSKSVAFEEIYDLFAIRIVIDAMPSMEKNVCWQAYSIVTDYYKPIPERLKDWITNPKANGYESLHTTVVGPNGRYVEVQIRTDRMDDIAERGFAAHWKYKGVKDLGTRANTFDGWLNQVRETLESDDSGNAVEFLADFQSNSLYADEIHIFTPKGEMKILPDGATALDYAFSIHSDLGCMCKSVIVNDRVAPIFHRLKNGDQVRIITDKNQKPTEDWLLHVITSKAKTRIRAALREEKRIQAEYGKEILARKLNAFKVQVEENVDMLARWYNYPNRTEFLSAIHLAQVELTGMNKRFKAEGSRLVELEEAAAHREDAEVPPNTDAPVRSKPGNRPEVIVNGEAGSYPYSFSPCCNPVQGDDIFAFISIKDGVKIHRYNCPNASNLLNNYGHRVLKAEWGNVVRSETVVPIVVTGVDTAGVIQRLTDRLYNLGINIRSFSMNGESGYFEGKISLIVANNDQLNRAITAIKGFDWVTNVSRAE
jgi:GTP diphosphokinase / guanosine-3',5'-bis(diphosphate) 3'-diphosphatase